MTPPTSKPQGCSNSPTVLIAANPYSGARLNRRRVQDLCAALRGKGLDPRVIWSREERAEILREEGLAERVRCVVVAGGDGTLADVINEGPQAPLAVMPLGTENLFAKEYGFRRNPDLLARIIARGECRAIDLGLAGKRRFSLMLGAGYDAEVVRRVAEWRAHGQGWRRGSRWAFVRSALPAVVEYDYPLIRLEADGTSFTGAQVMIINIPRYALRMKMAPNARDNDGLLNWVVFERRGILNMLDYFRSIEMGLHVRRRDVHHGTARRLRITSEGVVPIQLDGDFAGHAPREISILPGALRIIEAA